MNKQEALEEIFDIIDNIKCRYSTEESNFWHHYKIGVLDGLKWQQEKMYSEEEVLRIITSCKEYLSFGDEFNEKEWFEQFKKK